MNQVPADMLDTIIQGDCLEVMKRLPDGCVDAVVTDPPYPGLVGGYERGNFGGVAKGVHVSRSVGTPWGESLDWAKEARRVARYGHIVFCSHHSVSSVRQAFSACKPIALATWYKRNAPPTGKNCPRYTNEHIWLFSERPGIKWDNLRTTVLDIPTLSSGCFASERFLDADGSTTHATQKPVSLMMELVTCVQGVILDPFCGLGTTCVAAKRLGRHYIGIELDETYCRRARQRLCDTEHSLFTEPTP